jgi:hypothetical protein
MRTNHVFVIDSDRSGHRLSLDGNRIGLFATEATAEAAATAIARRFVTAAATLKFELDFKWTLSDLETRVATLQCPISQNAKKDLLCGSSR